MGQINILDQNMINVIAAGEVIERPASVVKELMENSIDAWATEIIVRIEQGGRKLISITDDGCGMDKEDLAKAFQQHATSKIKTNDDLDKISTLGFRGEALASIAAISQVKATSKTNQSNSAYYIEIDCGQKSDVAPCSANTGTAVEIRDIFYKMPARQKFLRTANTEFGHITEQFIRIALSNNNLNLTLIHNDKEVYRLQAGETVTERAVKLFPSLTENPEKNLMETSVQEKDISIYALMGKPILSKTTSKFQYAFLNGRYIRDKIISHAIREAYRRSLEPNRYPVVFLFLQMPAENFDVNVHPTKIEVRFFNSNLVHSQILGALREKLLATDFNIEAKFTTAQQPSGAIVDAISDFLKQKRNAGPQTQMNFTKTKSSITRPLSLQSKENFAGNTYNLSKKFIQIHDSYIVTQTNDGFEIIDQHALQERMIYEKLKIRISAGKLESQRLLSPQTFEVTPAQQELVRSNIEIIKKLGIELEPFGPDTLAIQSFPSLLGDISPLDFVSDLIDMLSDRTGPDVQALPDKILNMAACKAAIKAGNKLSDDEIEQLLRDKENTKESGRCPHGRPTTISFSITELEKQFKRT